MDVSLIQTNDGGEITVTNGQLLVDDGLATAVYLSLFGGNEDDSGLDGDKPRQWWGNLLETDPARRFRSETQFLLHSLPLIPINLRRIEDAAAADLAWMTDTKLASFVGVAASMPARNTVKIEIRIEIEGREFAPIFILYSRST